MSGSQLARQGGRIAAKALGRAARRATARGRDPRKDDHTKRALLVLAVLGVATLALPAALVGMVVLVAGMVGGQQSMGGAAGCGMTGSVVVAAGEGAQRAANGFTAEQLQNATVILQVGAERGVPAKAQAIAVMTALGESGMRNLTYGDDRFGVRNPDGTLTSSIGMFQEQKWFGTVEERLDPVASSGRFYDRLLAVEGWQAMEPTIAAHKAQRNADPYHYASYWDRALQVMRLVSGAEEQDLEALSASIQGASPAAPCLSGSIGQAAVSAGGWANPAVGVKASGYGPRSTGIAGASRFHQGQDIAAACGTPVYAAAAGRVVISGGTGWGTGNTIRIEHGLGLDTTYGHLLTGTNIVSVGDVVEAGQQIASMGGDSRVDPAGAGTSSGCHLHFEVRMNARAVDPEPFMAQQGVTLGTAAPAQVPEPMDPGEEAADPAQAAP
ncbi:M23 family metallopeptidase [Myceligenerans salitolerans]|uniref:M23 family metallopeptidase n=1 Tax=Myceligenerans salitolerans TaxID=1230528 RepID=A0ABS3I5K7_9MICO|nr:M23 family metallopeptidase [Myceligenerans salitolerans]MBO0608259.1 M23 family metallopeptidase [Myceligenerans salitolerans]